MFEIDMCGINLWCCVDWLGVSKFLVRDFFFFGWEGILFILVLLDLIVGFCLLLIFFLFVKFDCLFFECLCWLDLWYCCFLFCGCIWVLVLVVEIFLMVGFVGCCFCLFFILFDLSDNLFTCVEILVLLFWFLGGFGKGCEVYCLVDLLLFEVDNLVFF